MIFLSQKRVGVGGFGPIIGVILFVFFSFFPWKTWEYAIVSSDCALLAAILSAFLANISSVFD